MTDVIDSLQKACVLVVGDIMLDKYIYGNVSRISPEAPVPVLKAEVEKERLGGAANVANNIAMLNASCILIGAAGQDAHRRSVENMLDDRSINYFLAESGVCTTTKIRVIGERQQIVRIDYEEPLKNSVELDSMLDDAVASNLDRCGAVILSDYGKGLLSSTFTGKVIKTANRHGKMVIVDPKGSDWNRYTNATIVTPNVKELGEVAGVRVKNTDYDVVEYGSKIREKYNVKYLVVTRSEKGITIISESGVTHMKTQAQEVFDVSGAGDTVVATMACALASGAEIEQAVAVANSAAGIVVSKMGTVPVTYAELAQTVQKEVSASIEPSKLAALLDNHRELGHKIVFTNGCFDVLHRGHADYLKKAKALGDVLIVGLNSDSSVKRIKGESRPVNAEEDRAFMLASLEAVDYVVIFDDDTPEELIKKVRPDILVKGGDYRVDDVIGREYAKDVVIIDFVHGYSTTSTLQKIKEAN